MPNGIWRQQDKAIRRHQHGEQIKVSIDINSREFNGRWYTDISPWRVERVGAAAGATGADSAAIPPPPMDAPTLSAPMDAGDDLPF